MKLHTNYEATQAVFKKVIAAGGKLLVTDGQKLGPEMGVVVPRTPASTFKEMAYSRLPVYAVDGLIELIDKLDGFNTLPLYKKSKGVFKHVAFAQKNTTDEPVTKVEDLTYDQMCYLSSVRPSSMKGFLLNYKNTVQEVNNLKAENEKLVKLLQEVYNDNRKDLHYVLKDKIKDVVYS